MPGALVVSITAVHNWGKIIHVDPTLIAEGFDAKFFEPPLPNAFALWKGIPGTVIQ